MLFALILKPNTLLKKGTFSECQKRAEKIKLRKKQKMIIIPEEKFKDFGI